MTTDTHMGQNNGGVAQNDPTVPEPHSAYIAPPTAASAAETGAGTGAGAESAAPSQQAPQYSPPAQYGQPAQHSQLPDYAQASQSGQQAPGKNAYGYSIASFVIGIASIVSGWTLVAPIVGLVLGILALKRNTPERTLALWGAWMNGVILGFVALGILLFVTLAAFGIFSGAALSFVA